MKTLIILSLLFHFAFPVKHNLKYILTYSYGARSIPEFVAVAVVNEFQIAHCDSNRLTPQADIDWMEKLFKEKQERFFWYTDKCFNNQQDFKSIIESLMRRLNQTGGVHIFQRMNGCEWDDETGNISGFNQYGYDGEDFLAFDPTTLTWITPKPQAAMIKHEWDRDRNWNLFWKHALSYKCVECLKQYVEYGKSFFQRTELPSVSLLQKTPSSPVSCHASGFYPDRAALFWRKDGEELHEGVDHGEILPNHDANFQMSVDLNISSVTPEDWRRYECVFHLPGVKDDIITRLDKAVIRTNWAEEPSDAIVPAAAGSVVVLLILVAAIGFIVYKKKRAEFPPAAEGPQSSAENAFELPEIQIPDT